MKRALVLLATGCLAACGGSDAPTTATLTGECAAGTKLTFAPLSAGTVKAALGTGTFHYAGLVFPKKTSTVPDAGECRYHPGKVAGSTTELTVALNRKTDFFTSVDEARRLKDNALARPIAGMNGAYVFEEPSVGGRSVFAVEVDADDQIVWAHVEAPPSSRDATGAAVIALQQAVKAFDAPMEAKQP